MSEIFPAVMGAVAAVVGGLVSGTILLFHEYLNRPKLHIDYQGNSANRVEAEYTGENNTQFPEVYIRARVCNDGRRVAKNCRVYLRALEVVLNNGQTVPTILNDAKVLAWAGYRFEPLDIPQGGDFYADLMKVSKNQPIAHPNWNFSIHPSQLFASQQGLKTQSGTYRFRLMVTGENTKPATCDVDVSYDGNWHNLRAVQVS